MYKEGQVKSSHFIYLYTCLTGVFAVYCLFVRRLCSNVVVGVDGDRC